MRFINLRLVLLAVLLSAVAGCDKNTDPATQNPGKSNNFFIYDGYSFKIKSAVSYDTGDNLLEFWLSPSEGLKTIKEVETAGDYVVVKTHKSYIGTRDRFSGTASDNSSLRFCNMEFCKGDKGNGYIDIDLKNDVLTLDFIAENLYTKAAPQTEVMLKGSYSGGFVTENEVTYSNEWGIGRERVPVAEALYTEYEDGTKKCVTLTDENGDELHLQLTPENFGNRIVFPGTNLNGLSLTYGKGTAFDLQGAIGQIYTKLEGDVLKVELELNKGETRIRANYTGEYDTMRYKMNRYVYDYAGGESQVEGWHDIVKIMVKESSRNLTIYFSPSEGYTIAGSNSTHMPILSIPSSFVNNGRQLIYDLSGWKLEYDMMQVEKFENNEKPHPDINDWIEVNYVDDIYEINLEVSCMADGMDECSLDIYFKGQASN